MGGRSTIVAMLYAVGAIGREGALVIPPLLQKIPLLHAYFSFHEA